MVESEFACGKMMFRCFFTIILLAAAAISVSARPLPIKWSLELPKDAASIEAGRSVNVGLNAELDPGWKLYALDQPPGGPIATTIRAADGRQFVIVGDIRAPKPLEKVDPLFIGEDGKPLNTKFYESRVNFSLSIRADADINADDIAFDVRYQVCDAEVCLPPKTLRVSLRGAEEVRASATNPPAEAAYQQTVSAAVPPNTTQLGFWPFVWLAITLGALSLLTPCVFPMIPITVSYFTTHSAGSRSRSVKLAAIYSLGIIATFTILGMLLAIFVGAAGINIFAANPWVNLLITAIFLFFAFNLFGAYEISIPAGVLSALDKITRTKEGEGSGIIGALLMGLTFTLTSFTCTSPFVGTILVSASQGDWQMPLVGMLAFSAVFAMPFFVLALAPQLLSQLPRAGGWMNSVKVSMGFLEVAAAMKFLSNADLVWKWGIFTRDVVLSVWIAIGIVLTIYLLGKFQLAHDSRPERIGSIRMISAVISLAISFYLLTGLFGAKLGELESFLPPDLNKSSARLYGREKDELQWIVNDFDGAMEKARSENRRVFLDFTGYTCTNCRWMEANIFPLKEVEEEMRNFILVQLYTDGNGPVYERNQQLEQDMFGTVALPFYAVLEPTGTVVSTFPGLTRDPSAFVDFLRKSRQDQGVIQ
jgi:thiol:disulfide interchange protein DsbD